MVEDFRSFLRLQSDAWLIALNDKLADALLQRTRTTSFSYVGKSGSTDVEVSTPALAQQLADVMMERGINGATKATRCTAARFV